MNSTATLPSPSAGSVAWTLPVEGMTCASCVARVEKALAAIPGVDEATVNIATEVATVRAGTGVGLETLRSAVERAGYGVKEQSIDLAVEGMTCASCGARVEKALMKVPGVLSAEVNLATETATVKVIGAIDAAALAAAVEGAGYQARERVVSTEPSRSAAANDWWPVALAAVLSLPLVIPMIARLFGADWMLLSGSS